MTFAQAHDWFSYDGERLRWKKVPRHSHVRGGEVAGCIDNYGYSIVRLFNKAYKAHRIIYLMQTGSFPRGEIDHIDGNPSNNRIQNLRDVTRRENGCNKYQHRNGKLPGCTFVRKARSKPWEARIGHNGKLVYLGNFKTEAEAHERYEKAKEELRWKL